MNVEIVVLNCQKCIQCLKGHKSLWVLYGNVCQQCVGLSQSLSYKLHINVCWEFYHFKQWQHNVNKCYMWGSLLSINFFEWGWFHDSAAKFQLAHWTKKSYVYDRCGQHQSLDMKHFSILIFRCASISCIRGPWSWQAHCSSNPPISNSIQWEWFVWSPWSFYMYVTPF